MRYFCTICGEIYGLGEPRWRCDCGGPLELSSPPASLADIGQEPSAVWRYAALLPPVAEEARISLGEQATPLIMTDLGARLKLDYLLPSGSYKDRGAAVLASRLADLGVKDIVLDYFGAALATVAFEIWEQASAFDSVAHAFASGLAEPVPRWAGHATLAEGIACELPVRGRQVLAAIRSSSGGW